MGVRSCETKLKVTERVGKRKKGFRLSICVYGGGGMLLLWSYQTAYRKQKMGLRREHENKSKDEIGASILYIRREFLPEPPTIGCC